MTTPIKKLQFIEQQIPDELEELRLDYLNLLGDVSVECSVRLGTLSLTLNDLKHLSKGQIFSLNQKTNEPIDLIINNRVVARGELMNADDHFALLITEVGA